MKYIVDVPDNTTWIQVSTDRLEPYIEPDRKAIEDEVWEFVCKFVWAVDDKKILGTDILHAVRDMSYQEAKAKYEAWKKQKEGQEKEKVMALAGEIGIHKLYALVCDIRGE